MTRFKLALRFLPPCLGVVLCAAWSFADEFELTNVQDVQDAKAEKPETSEEAKRLPAKLAQIYKDLAEDRTYKQRVADADAPKGYTIEDVEDPYLAFANWNVTASNPELRGQLTVPVAMVKYVSEMNPRYKKHGLYFVSFLLEKARRISDVVTGKTKIAFGRFSPEEKEFIRNIFRFAAVNKDVWVYTDQGKPISVGMLFKEKLASIAKGPGVQEWLHPQAVPPAFAELLSEWNKENEAMLGVYREKKYKQILEEPPLFGLIMWGSDMLLKENASLEFGEADGMGLYDPASFRGKIPKAYRDDPRFLLGWLYLQMNMPGRSYTKQGNIKAMELAEFIWLNKNLVMLKDPFGGAPYKLWCIFMEPTSIGGQRLRDWDGMMKAFSITPNSGPQGAMLSLMDNMVTLLDAGAKVAQQNGEPVNCKR